jgi:glyoxylase-like metal-dependent hydrolase (beta-lactamase superfamily II)
MVPALTMVRALTMVPALILVPALLLAPALHAQNARPAATFAIAAVKDGLYLISGEGGNVAAFVTDEGVVLVDNMFDRSHAAILAQLATVTDQPIAWVINTHQHDDHAGGNYRLLPIAEVIAHDNVRRNLSDIRQPYYEDTPGTPIGLPELTFADEFALHLAQGEVRALHLGRGHTNGDVIVLFPAQGVIHTGDLFLASRAPRPAERPPGVNIYVDYAQGGSVLEWTATLDRVLALDFDTIIPGHGPLATRADLVRFRADLAAMRERIAALIAMGASKAQVLAVFETDYGWRSTGCPPSPPTPGCLQYQQMDALIDELKP